MSLKYISGLSVLLCSMEKRFNDFIYFQLKANDAILAAVSHSYFKIAMDTKREKKITYRICFS